MKTGMISLKKLPTKMVSAFVVRSCLKTVSHFLVFSLASAIVKIKVNLRITQRLLKKKEVANLKSSRIFKITKDKNDETVIKVDNPNDTE